jgi:ribosome-binding factor A
MDEIRHRKLEEQVREELSSLIMGGEVKDPRVGPFVSLTRVEAARDLSYARVFVSSFAAAADHPGAEGQDDDKILSQAVDGLNHAAGFMQSRIARRLRTRLTPKLQFVADKGIREGFELNERIKGLFT